MEVESRVCREMNKKMYNMPVDCVYMYSDSTNDTIHFNIHIQKEKERKKEIFSISSTHT
jgi:hypothetical protein